MSARMPSSFAARRLAGLAALAAGVPVFGGCRGALAPASESSDRIAILFWIMAGAAAAIWIAVLLLAAYARYRRQPPRRRVAMALIVIGGAVVPVLGTAALLVGSLPMLPWLHAPHDGLQIRIEAERWWWRVHYRHDGRIIESANELRLPAGEPVTLLLGSRDVIHSLWIPELAGKLDMIPGRQTRLLLRPARSGRFDGLCAEYCGSAHARMRFTTVVMPRPRFDTWLARQAAPRAPAASDDDGARAFLSRGCGGCHRVRGSAADGRIGPDLTHLASRSTLAAGTLPMTRRDLERWIARPQHYKPGALMPAYDMLEPAERRAIADWLLEDA